MPTQDLLKEGSIHTLKINRMMVDGVVETPNGAHFTECPPDYPRDEAFQKAYAASAADEAAWTAFKTKYLDVDDAEYRRLVTSGGAK